LILILALLTCGDCHQEIVQRFSRSPMGRTSGAVQASSEPAASFFHEPSRTRFEIVRSEGKLELRWLAQKQDLPFFIGSGRMGRSYAFLEDGYLYEAPVGYYSNRRAWDAAPGYEHDSAPDLARPITTECLYCHASGARALPGTLNRIADTSALHGVGCERCHGDGVEHSEHPRSGNIVNPAKLSERLRDSVCEQCHLAGEVRLSIAGKKLEDFRPGMELANFLQVFVNADSKQGVRVNGHAEALGQSRCRIASGEKLWCGTCHDPHAATVSYRERCLQCHQPAQCPSPSAQHGECVECHMPKARAFDGGHTVFTDHSISRRPAHRSDRVPVKELRPYFAGPQAKGMADRNLGIAYGDVGQLEQSWKYLRAAVTAGARDPALYTRVAAMLQADGRYDQAEVYYRESLAMDADQLGAAAGLASLLEHAGRKSEAGEFRRRAITLCPRQATKHATAASK
jgi:tetratricopeptide (TPR) repeat protein